MLISTIYATNIGDIVAIYDSYPLFVIIFTLIIEKLTMILDYSDEYGNKHIIHYGSEHIHWKHRYFLSFILIIIGLIFIVKAPAFIDSYNSNSSSNSNTRDEFLACLFALLSSLLSALGVIASIMLTKASYYNLMKQEMTLSQYQSMRSMRKLKSNDILITDDTETAPLNWHEDELNQSITDAKNDDDANDENDTNMNGNDEINGNEDADDMITVIEEFQEKFFFKQSKEYIIQNDFAVTILNVEYMSITIILLCIIFSPLSLINDDINFFDQFKIFGNNNDIYHDLNTLCYVIVGSILWFIDNFLFIFGMWKLSSAPLAGLLDISDVVWTYIASYIWLTQTPTVYGIIGALLIILSVLVTIYPWQKIHTQLPKAW